MNREVVYAERSSEAVNCLSFGSVARHHYADLRPLALQDFRGSDDDLERLSGTEVPQIPNGEFLRIGTELTQRRRLGGLVVKRRIDPIGNDRDLLGRKAFLEQPF